MKLVMQAMKKNFLKNIGLSNFSKPSPKMQKNSFLIQIKLNVNKNVYFKMLKTGFDFQSKPFMARFHYKRAMEHSFFLLLIFLLRLALKRKKE